MTWPVLVVLMLPPIVGLLLGLLALRPGGAFMTRTKPVQRLSQDGRLMILEGAEYTAVRASPLTADAQAALLRDRGLCPNFAACQDPAWCQRCGSCDVVARQTAAGEPRAAEPADLHEVLARQWDRLGMPDLAATERGIAAKLRRTT